MFRLFSKKQTNEWVYEALDRQRKMIGIFPTASMAERFLKEQGGGTIRPRKVSPAEAEEIAKKARTRRKGIAIPPRAEKPAKAPVPAVRGKIIGRMSGSQLKHDIEVYSAIGGKIPLGENPVTVIDETHVSAYETENPFGLQMFSGGEMPPGLRSPAEGMSKVVDSTELKRAAKIISAKKTYDISIQGRDLVFDDGKDTIRVPITDDTSHRIGFFDTDLEVYVWVTGSNFHNLAKSMAKVSDCIYIGVANDGFVHMWAEDDGIKIMDTAVGLADGFSVRTFTSCYPSKYLTKMSAMFKGIQDVKAEFGEDYPIRFLFEDNGRRFRGMVAPRIENR